MQEGETLALVGPSGSGKSSVAALLARMYEPDGGQILLGPRRVPLATIPKRTLRKAVSYVTQASGHALWLCVIGLKSCCAFGD